MLVDFGLGVNSPLQLILDLHDEPRNLSCLFSRNLFSETIEKLSTMLPLFVSPGAMVRKNQYDEVYAERASLGGSYL